MLFRYFWEDWVVTKDFKKYPKLEHYVKEKIFNEFGSNSLEDAEVKIVGHLCRDFIPYKEDIFGPYPDLLKPYLNNPKYRLIISKGKIIGREEL